MVPRIYFAEKVTPILLFRPCAFAALCFSPLPLLFLYKAAKFIFAR